MTSRAEQLISLATSGSVRARREERTRPRFGVPPPAAADAAGAALVLGSAAALWAAFFAAVW